MKKLLFWLCMMVNYATAQPQITWLKQFETIYKLNTYGTNIVQLSDTTYTLLANYHGKPKIIHLNALGDTLWTKTFGTNFQAHSFIKTTDGGYAMLGYINDVVLIKMDSMGDTLWSKAYPQLNDSRCLLQTSDGGYAISSYQTPDLIKTDSVGFIEWLTSTSSGLHVQGVIECFNKNYLIFGNSGFNPYCYKAALFDSLGILIWVNYYGNVTYLGADIESILSAVQLPDSNFIFGCSIDTFQQGQYCLLKVNYSDGSLLDSLKYTDIFTYNYCKLILLNDSNVLVRTSDYIKKITPSLSTIWKKIIPFGVNSIEETSDNGFIASGGNVFQLTGLSRIEYAKLDSLGNIYNFQGIPSIAVNALRVYPNPAFNQLAISNEQLAIGQEVTLTIYDMLGKVQLQQSLIPQGDFTVDVKGLSNGLYMLQLKQEDRLYNGRFVKE